MPNERAFKRRLNLRTREFLHKTASRSQGNTGSGNDQWRRSPNIDFRSTRKATNAIAKERVSTREET